MHRVDWNDLQFLLGVADAGSLSGAARRLGVNHTTVLRRLNAFEKQLGVRLFDRLATGYSLTAAGEELARAARDVDETVTDVERRLVGQDLRLTGTVRVTTTDTLAAALVPAALGAFARAHPDVALELTTTTALASLTKRDADIAVRASSKPPPNLVGRRVARVAYAPYAAPAYLEQLEKHDKTARRRMDRWDWLLPDDSLAGSTVARWAARELRGVRIALRADTLTALGRAAEAGLGVAALPCYYGDLSSGLRRARAPIETMSSELWVLTHEDLRGTARIRALTDALVELLDTRRDLVEGRRPRAAPRAS